MFEDQKKQNTIFYQELGKINTSIGSLSGGIEALNKEKRNGQGLANTSGSFGTNVNTAKPNTNTAYLGH